MAGREAGRAAEAGSARRVSVNRVQCIEKMLRKRPGEIYTAEMAQVPMELSGQRHGSEGTSIACIVLGMTKDATDLMAAALRIAKVDGSFSPADVGAKIGLSRGQSELAARALANAGVLVLGFDYAAQFSSDFRKSQRTGKAAEGKPRRKKA